MDDLIRREDAMQRFSNEVKQSRKDHIHINTIKRLLDDVDIAYNVDKVVEQVEEITDRINNYCEEIDHNIPEDERSGYNMLPDIFKLREVVKAGGVNG